MANDTIDGLPFVDRRDAKQALTISGPELVSRLADSIAGAASYAELTIAAMSVLHRDAMAARVDYVVDGRSALAIEAWLGEVSSVNPGRDHAALTGVNQTVTLALDGDRVALVIACGPIGAAHPLRDAVWRPIVEALLRVAQRQLVTPPPLCVSSVVEQSAGLVDARGILLLRGEPGSCFEMLARQLHDQSDRRGGPFVTVDAASLPEASVEDVLASRVQQAEGGTLFVEEVGLLPMYPQLRLQDVTGKVILAASRGDVFVGCLPVSVPPLRRRPDDLIALATHFIRSACARWGRPTPSLNEEQLRALLQHDWAGNARELQSLIDQALLMSGDGPLVLPTLVRRRPAAGVRTFDQAVRDAIETALESSRGRVAGPHGAAAMLGLNSNTLHSKIRKLGIKREVFV